MLKLLLTSNKYSVIKTRYCSTAKENVVRPQDNPALYETVFSFPFIKYISVLNRLKVYHFTATSLALPSCGLMEVLDVLPQGAFLAAAYIGTGNVDIAMLTVTPVLGLLAGFTGAAVLSLTSVPFNNTIGYLYIRVDDKKIKISSVDFWGERKDRIVSVNDWCPLLDLPSKTMDAIYLTPQLSDGTKYKMFVKFGNVLNSKRIGQVLE